MSRYGIFLPWVCCLAGMMNSFLCLAQQEIRFPYLNNRLGTLQVHYFLETQDGRQSLPNHSSFDIAFVGEPVLFVIKLSKLTLGIDQDSKLIKRIRDRQQFFVTIPNRPEYITQNGLGLELVAISNEGRLADQSSGLLNTTVEVIYQMSNPTPRTLDQTLAVQFYVDAIPGKSPIRSSERGGGKVMTTVHVAPDPQIILEAKVRDLYLKIMDSSLTQEVRKNHAEVLMNQYAQVNADWTRQVKMWYDQEWLNLPTRSPEEKHFDRIERAYSMGNKSLCYSFCMDYDQQVILQPNLYSGKFLPRVLYYGILAAGPNQSRQQREWKERLQSQYPNFEDLDEIMEMNLTSKSMSSQKRKTGSRIEISMIDTTELDSLDGIKLDSMTVTDNLDSVEFIETIGFAESNVGKMNWNESSNDLSLRTNGVAGVYVVSFYSEKDNHLVANPSFKGEEKRFNLEDLTIPNGTYNVKLSTLTGEELDRITLVYRSHRLSSEWRYILMVCLGLVVYGAYRKYFDL